jgi:hypothetical protein
MGADFHNFLWKMLPASAPPGKTNWRGEPRNMILRGEENHLGEIEETRVTLENVMAGKVPEAGIGTIGDDMKADPVPIPRLGQGRVFAFPLVLGQATKTPFRS